MKHRLQGRIIGLVYIGRERFSKSSDRADAFEQRTGNMARVARGSEVKTHHSSEFYDEDEDLHRKIHELTCIFTVAAKTARDRH